MEKYIISTTGSKIEFSLSGSRKLIIETTIPTQVTEAEFNILEKRLGSLIRETKIAGTSSSKKDTKTEKPKEDSEEKKGKEEEDKTV